MIEFSQKIELSKIPGAVVMDGKGQYQGQKLVILPVNDCHLYANPNTGAVSIDLLIHRRQSVGQYGHTHFATQSLPKDFRATLTEEQQKAAAPIISDIKPWGNPQPQQQAAQQAPVNGNAYQQAAAYNQSPAPQNPNSGDLPF